MLPPHSVFIRLSCSRSLSEIPDPEFRFELELELEDCWLDIIFNQDVMIICSFLVRSLIVEGCLGVGDHGQEAGLYEGH